MKTFEDYMSESRQNYIFGGTDDRNADLEDEPKKLSELKKYDNVYYFNTWTMKRPDIATIADISSGKTKTCISLSLKSNSNTHIATVYNKGLDEDCFFRYLQDPGGDFEVISTNKDSFLSELSGHYRRTIDTSLLNKVDESIQNYIFGGTDNRNTNAGVKSFDELKKGDFLYVFDSENTKPYITKVFGTYLDNGMLRINYRVDSYVLLATLTQNGAKESFAIRYSDDKTFEAYSTDKDLMIDELEKLNYYFIEDDFVKKII